jgi:hypothetical protein
VYVSLLEHHVNFSLQFSHPFVLKLHREWGVGMVDWPQTNKGILSLAAAVDAILIVAQAAPSLATSQRGSSWTAVTFYLSGKSS